MAKDKKKKNDKKKDKGAVAGAGALDTLKTLGSNRLVNDVVAAALVATAAALKDSDKARRLASAAGDELEKMSKDAADRGCAMWKLALDVGRRALESVGSEPAAKAKPPKTKAEGKVKSSAGQSKAAASPPKRKRNAAKA